MVMSPNGGKQQRRIWARAAWDKLQNDSGKGGLTNSTFIGCFPGPGRDVFPGL